MALPVALPGIIAWGLHLHPRLERLRLRAHPDYLRRPQDSAVGIADLYNASVIDWGMMSAGMLMIVPVVAVFIYIQRFLVAGWGAGAIKG